jgi:hypothetical protein
LQCEFIFIRGMQLCHSHLSIKQVCEVILHFLIAFGGR